MLQCSKAKVGRSLLFVAFLLRHELLQLPGEFWTLEKNALELKCQILHQFMPTVPKVHCAFSMGATLSLWKWKSKSVGYFQLNFGCSFKNGCKQPVITMFRTFSFEGNSSAGRTDIIPGSSFISSLRSDPLTVGIVTWPSNNKNVKCNLHPFTVREGIVQPNGF